jgi:hypothetical protein
LDAKRNRRLRDRPLVALDWGYVQSLPRDSLYLPNRYNYVIPEIAFLEASTSTGGEPVGLVRKLIQVLQLNWSRVFLASHLGHLAPLEDVPGKTVDRLLIANRPFFSSQEHADGFDTGHGAGSFVGLSEDEHPYRSIQTKFDEGRALFSKRIGEAAAESRPLATRPLEEFDAGVVEPKAAAGYPTLFHEKYGSAEWRAVLEVFPDRHAVGRWWRAAVWYWLREARGVGSRRLRNDWADLVYVFTSSYADQFWTADNGAAEVVRLLFPGVRVVCVAPESVGTRSKAISPTGGWNDS